MKRNSYFSCSECTKPFMIKLMPEKQSIYKYCRCGNSIEEPIKSFQAQFKNTNIINILQRAYNNDYEDCNKYCVECDIYFNEKDTEHSDHNIIDLTKEININEIERNINAIKSQTMHLKECKTKIINELVELVNNVQSSYEKWINNLKYVYKKYSFLLEQLVSRDFKVKYKRSVLGVVWSLLYPLLMMAVMAIVFSNVFKFSTPGVSYLAYLLIGLTYFNYFSEASNLAMSSVVGNFSLINKVYIPKYIFPLSKCIFVGINFLLTLIPLYIVIIATGTGLCWQHILLPFFPILASLVFYFTIFLNPCYININVIRRFIN